MRITIPTFGNIAASLAFSLTSLISVIAIQLEVQIKCDNLESGKKWSIRWMSTHIECILKVDNESQWKERP